MVGEYEYPKLCMTKEQLENLQPGEQFQETMYGDDEDLSCIMTVVSRHETKFGKTRLRYSYLDGLVTRHDNLIIGSTIDEDGIQHLRSESKPVFKSTRKFFRYVSNS